MSNKVSSNDSLASASALLGRGGSLRTEQPSMSPLSKGVLAVTAMLVVVLLCGVGLRVSVGLVSDQPHASEGLSVTPVSRSKGRSLTARQREHERIREEARRKDRELLSRRQERLWREQCIDRPDETAAYQKWYAEVREIEDQLQVAEQIQSQLGPEDAEHGPLSEGTVLWHRKQRLLELKADGPRL
ncbi:MAG: hypothetical protein ACF787_00795 [Rhodopirellula sp. JB053]|uniref:hypothetical protein n=1 Tax=Rhodopirellula sp. JB044 TaxID=3342844 RepID=UPI003709D589